MSSHLTLLRPGEHGKARWILESPVKSGQNVVREPEILQNVRRINRDPSNVQWAGGNEVEGIVTYTNWSLENGTRYLNEVSRDSASSVWELYLFSLPSSLLYFRIFFMILFSPKLVP
jgi:hypothetical protein